MGCCLSTEENRATQKQSPNLHQQLPCISKSPPRFEEESVKEVLSETPKPRPKPQPEPESEATPGIEIRKQEDPKAEDLVEVPTKHNLILSPNKQLPVIGLKYPDPSGHIRACTHKPRPIPGIEIRKNENPKTDVEEPTKLVIVPKYTDPSGHGRACNTPEEISDVSEMCSQVSESISTSTLREREEDEDEVLQRVYRSQGHNSHFTRKNRVVSSGGSRSSPVRKSDPSPTRRRNMVSGKPAENPGRRSRSPATRSNVGRSPSGRRTGPSPGRVRNGPGPERQSGVKKVEEDINGGRRENEDEKEWEGPNESLENPLVSLECFIFL